MKMKAGEEASTRVRCDEKGCGWEVLVRFDDVPVFYRKPCPKCGGPAPINAGDLLLWAIVKGLQWLRLARPARRGEAPAKGYERMHVDSKGWHERKVDE